MLVNSSSRLIAVFHVFHRLSVPRHPPYALSFFNYKTQIKYIFQPYKYKIFERSTFPKQKFLFSFLRTNLKTFESLKLEDYNTNFIMLKSKTYNFNYKIFDYELLGKF